MRRLFFAGFGVLLLAVSAAHAAAADAAKKTRACLAAAQTQGGNPQLCVGLIAAACLKTAKDEDMPEAACAAQELAFWQTELDRNWKALQPLLAGFPEAKGPQLAAQKAWLDYRDKSCAVADKVDPGMMPGGTARCRMEETAARAIALRQLVDALSEH